MNWSDPNHDVIGDIRQVLREAPEHHRRLMESEPDRLAVLDQYMEVQYNLIRKRGRQVQNNMINETNDLINEVETSREERKRKAHDFVSDEVNPTSLHILAGLNRQGMHVYAGTVSGAEKEKRRARNKRARAARRKSR